MISSRYVVGWGVFVLVWPGARGAHGLVAVSLLGRGKRLKLVFPTDGVFAPVSQADNSRAIREGFEMRGADETILSSGDTKLIGSDIFKECDKTN